MRRVMVYAKKTARQFRDVVHGGTVDVIVRYDCGMVIEEIRAVFDHSACLAPDVIHGAQHHFFVVSLPVPSIPILIMIPQPAQSIADGVKSALFDIKTAAGPDLTSMYWLLIPGIKIHPDIY